MKRVNTRKTSASDVLLLVQGLLMASLGIAAGFASSVVMAGFNAMSDRDMAVAFITEESLITDKTTISTADAAGIINNFQLVCYSALTIGLVIAFACIIRIIKHKYF